MDAIRVLLVDDQEIIRRGLATILRYEPGIEVVGQAENGQEALDLSLKLHPDVVMMDIKMPKLGGIPATRKIVTIPTIWYSRGSRRARKDICSRMPVRRRWLRRYMG